MKRVSLIFVLSFLISACGSESESQSNGSEQVTQSISGWPVSGQNIAPDSFGYLLDSAVEGLRYKSGGHYGVTDSDGRFGYISGENIEFYVGNNMIAYADTPTELLTPYEFSNGSPFTTVDVLRLLQSLDDDGNPNNGIQITEAVHQLAVSVALEPFLDFNFPPDNIDPDVIMKLTSITTAGTRNTVSAYDAYFHYAGTLGVLIDELEVDIQSLADQTTCVSNDQCAIAELKTSATYYCPPAGPSIIYSNNDIDQLQFDTLVAEREYLIKAKSDVEIAADANDTSTGFCAIVLYPPVFPVCNALNRCEI